MPSDDKDSDNNLKSYYENICRIMLLTSRARFYAADMLKAKDRASLVISASLSIILIVVSVIQLSDVAVLSSRDSKIITIISIAAAIGVLTQTIFDWALSRAALSVKLYENALQITHLMRKMERELTKERLDPERLDCIANKYEKLNILTGVNHSSFDYFLSNRSDCYWSFGPINFCKIFKLILRHASIVLSSFFGVMMLLITIIGLWILLPNLVDESSNAIAEISRKFLIFVARQ